MEIGKPGGICSPKTKGKEVMDENLQKGNGRQNLVARCHY